MGDPSRVTSGHKASVQFSSPCQQPIEPKSQLGIVEMPRQSNTRANGTKVIFSEQQNARILVAHSFMSMKHNSLVGKSAGDERTEGPVILRRRSKNAENQSEQPFRGSRSAENYRVLGHPQAGRNVNHRPRGVSDPNCARAGHPPTHLRPNRQPSFEESCLNMTDMPYTQFHEDTLHTLDVDRPSRSQAVSKLNSTKLSLKNSAVLLGPQRMIDEDGLHSIRKEQNHRQASAKTQFDVTFAGQMHPQGNVKVGQAHPSTAGHVSRYDRSRAESTLPSAWQPLEPEKEAYNSS